MPPEISTSLPQAATYDLHHAFGRFYFNRLPFGITSAPAIFQQHLNAILCHIPNVVIYMDDILVFGRTIQEHDDALEAVWTALATTGAQLNDTKSHIYQKSVRFLGYVVTADGVRPDPAKLDAIKSMPAPTNIAELHCILGLFTLPNFVPNMATVSAPLHSLLKTDTHWTWDVAQEDAFEKLQALAASAPCLALFNISQPVRISAAASGYGLGAVLLQPGGQRWCPVAFASHSLLPAEKKYTQIEKECLAVTWACEHFHHYIYSGPSFTVETDHKPPVPLINNTDLNCVPLSLRCQRLLLRLMCYSLNAIHVPEKDLIVANTLSRAPSPAPESVAELSAQVEAHMLAVADETDLHLDGIRTAIFADPDFQQMKSFIANSWPSKQSLVKPSLRPYYSIRFQLSTHNDVIYRDRCILIPASFRNTILTTIRDDSRHSQALSLSVRGKRLASNSKLPTITSDTVRENCRFS